MEQRSTSNQAVGLKQTSCRRQVSLAVESDQVITGYPPSGSAVYSISSWLDEQLRNPSAAPKRSFHGYYPYITTS
jgi:hypothetical protein